jgi:hypothetical protein
VTTLKIDIDQATYEKLVAMAFRERRATRDQAAVLLTWAVAKDPVSSLKEAVPSDSMAHMRLLWD